MSLFFGKKKKEQAPTTAEAIQKLRQTEELLEKKQAFLEKKIEGELNEAKTKYRQKQERAAIMALKRKKRLEKQLAQIDGTLSTIEYQREALENANTNTEVLSTMSYAGKALKSAHKQMNVEDVDDMMADLQEQLDVANEISDAISSSVGFGQGIDEDELRSELEELEQEELDEQLLDVGPNIAPRLPDVPTDKPAKVANQEDEDMKELAAWAS